MREAKAKLNRPVMLKTKVWRPKFKSEPHKAIKWVSSAPDVWQFEHR